MFFRTKITFLVSICCQCFLKCLKRYACIFQICVRSIRYVSSSWLWIYQTFICLNEKQDKQYFSEKMFNTSQFVLKWYVNSGLAVHHLFIIACLVCLITSILFVNWFDIAYHSWIKLYLVGVEYREILNDPTKSKYMHGEVWRSLCLFRCNATNNLIVF